METEELRESWEEGVEMPRWYLWKVCQISEDDQTRSGFGERNLGEGLGGEGIEKTLVEI